MRIERKKTNLIQQRKSSRSRGVRWCVLGRDDVEENTDEKVSYVSALRVRVLGGFSSRKEK